METQEQQKKIGETRGALNAKPYDSNLWVDYSNTLDSLTPNELSRELAMSATSDPYWGRFSSAINAKLQIKLVEEQVAAQTKSAEASDRLAETNNRLSRTNNWLAGAAAFFALVQIALAIWHK